MGCFLSNACKVFTVIHYVYMACVLVVLYPLVVSSLHASTVCSGYVGAPGYTAPMAYVSVLLCQRYITSAFYYVSVLSSTCSSH